MRMTGGSAFPIKARDGFNEERELGLTKREWFAGMALANTRYVAAKNCPDTTARYAIDVADSMLKLLED